MRTFNDTVDTAVDTAKSTLESAKSTMEHAKEETGEAASTLLSKITDGARIVSGMISIARSFGVNDALGLVGLRRRNPFEAVALFGSGMIVGAGVGLLLAPASGAELRNAILARLKGAEGDAKRTIANVGEAATKMEHKVEAAATAMEQKIEKKAETLVKNVKDAADNVAHKNGVAAARP